MIINLGHVQIWQQTIVLSRWQSKTLCCKPWRLGTFIDLEEWVPWWPATPQTEGSLPSLAEHPYCSSTPGESPAGFFGPGLSLSPLICYRNLKTHVPAIPVNPCLSLSLHGIRRMQDNLRIPGGYWATPRPEALIQKGQKDFWDPRLGTKTVLQATAGQSHLRSILQFQEPVKEQTKLKVRRKKEITKIRAEMKWRVEKQQINLMKVVEWIN